MSLNSPLIHFLHPTHLTSLARLTHFILTHSTHPIHSAQLLASFTHHSSAHSLTHSPHSLTHSPTPSLTHSLTRSLRLLSLTPLSSFEGFTCGVLRSFNFLPTSQMRLSRFYVWRRLPNSFHLWFWATLAKNVCTCKDPHVLHFPKFAKAHGAQARTHLRKTAPHGQFSCETCLKRKLVEHFRREGRRI